MLLKKTKIKSTNIVIYFIKKDQILSKLKHQPPCQNNEIPNENIHTQIPILTPPIVKQSQFNSNIDHVIKIDKCRNVPLFTSIT